MIMKSKMKLTDSELKFNVSKHHSDIDLAFDL